MVLGAVGLNVDSYIVFSVKNCQLDSEVVFLISFVSCMISFTHLKDLISVLYSLLKSQDVFHLSTLRLVKMAYPSTLFHQVKLYVSSAPSCIKGQIILAHSSIV